MQDPAKRVLFEMLERQSKKGGFSLNSVGIGSTLIVETRNSFYELIRTAHSQVKIFGGTMNDGSTRFAKPTLASYHGCTFGGSVIIPNWVGEGMQMELMVFNDKTGLLLTTAIRNVIIEASDRSWSYSMNWKKG